MGSPPRMRGKVSDGVLKGCKSGITPAHAGKSDRADGGMVAIWDHPRACGEKTHSAWMHQSVRGSPPRMRGKVSFVTSRTCIMGITPAHAGKSVSCVSLPYGTWDHPRACGEKSTDKDTGSPSLGSPPRMRGKDLESIEIQALFFLCAQISFNF